MCCVCCAYDFLSILDRKLTLLPLFLLPLCHSPNRKKTRQQKDLNFNPYANPSTQVPSAPVVTSPFNPARAPATAGAGGEDPTAAPKITLATNKRWGSDMFEEKKVAAPTSNPTSGGGGGATAAPSTPAPAAGADPYANPYGSPNTVAAPVQHQPEPAHEEPRKKRTLSHALPARVCCSCLIAWPFLSAIQRFDRYSSVNAKSVRANCPISCSQVWVRPRLRRRSLPLRHRALSHLHRHRLPHPLRLHRNRHNPISICSACLERVVHRRNHHSSSRSRVAAVVVWNRSLSTFDFSGSLPHSRLSMHDI